MGEIRDNAERNGNFTSSTIVALVKRGSRSMTESELAEYKEANPKGRKTTIESDFSDAGLTYIKQKNYERRLGRPLENDSTARPLVWGSLVEKRVFDILPTSYILTSNLTASHSTLKCFKGSPDGHKKDTVIEIKAPQTLNSFCNLVDPIYNGLIGIDAINWVRSNHSEGEKYFWQTVANSILLDVPYAELIVYVPYKSELDIIRELAQNATEEELFRYFYIANSRDEELPYLLDGGFYKNLNKIHFEVPKGDKEFLLSRIELASKYLIEPLIEAEKEVVKLNESAPQKDYQKTIRELKELMQKLGI